MTTPVDLTPSDTTFAELGVDERIVAALTEAGISHPFPIQEMAIPIALTGTDLIGQARTGTGKTLAFGIPLLQHLVLATDEDFADLVSPGKPQALVMTPTRELALQVSHDIEVAGRARGARVLTIYGGVGYDEQLAALASGVDLVVGTPGRLLDLANRRDLQLGSVTQLVLDEADEMLDLGFLPDVEALIRLTSSDRQTMLFSATMPTQIVALSRSIMQQPVRVRAEGQDAQMTVPDTKQFVYQAHELDKPEILGKLLQSDAVDKVMVFTHTKRSAQRLADELVDRGFAAATIHGDLSQAAREKALRRFRRNEIKVLVATDVAARGIDVTGVSHVVNYECPDDAKTYVHRIGRTGRAGNKGVAVTLVDWPDLTKWKVINRTLELSFPEPPESYSTSEQLLQELEIPAGTKGRIAEAKPRAPRHSDSRGTRRHSDGGRSSGDAPRAARRPRNRRRMRNGKPVDRPTRDERSE